MTYDEADEVATEEELEIEKQQLDMKPPFGDPNFERFSSPFGVKVIYPKEDADGGQ